MAVLLPEWSEWDVYVEALPRELNLIGPATLANEEVGDPLCNE
jgi:hypothetical protein